MLAEANIPLDQKSTYFVALLKGIKSTDGKEFTGSYTWGLVSASENPVTLDEQRNVVSDRYGHAIENLYAA